MVDGNETASDSDSDWHVAFTDFRSVADAHFACTYRHRHRHPNAHELAAVDFGPLLLVLGPRSSVLGPVSCSLPIVQWFDLENPEEVPCPGDYNIKCNAFQASAASCRCCIYIHSLCMLSASSGPGQELLLQLRLLLRCSF